MPLALLAAILMSPPDPLPDGAVARLGSARLRHGDRPTVLVFSPDGTRLYSGGSDGTVRAWDAGTGAALAAFPVADGNVTALAVSPDGGTVAAHFGTDRLYALSADLRVRSVHPCPTLDAVAVTDKGALTAGVTLSNAVRVTDAAGLERMLEVLAKSVAFAPGGKAVARGEPGAVRVADVLSGQVTHTFAYPAVDGAAFVAWSPDGTRLAAADTASATRVRVWRLGAEPPEAEFAGTGPLAFAGADTLVGLADGQVTLWAARTGVVRHRYAAGVKTFAVSADGKRIATAGSGARIAIRDAATGEEPRPDADGLGRVAGLAGTADGRGVIAVGERAVVRWTPGDPTPTVVARPPAGAVAAVRPGLLLASPGQARLWAKHPAGFADEAKLVPLPARVPLDAPPSAAGLSPDGSRAAVAFEDKSVVLIDPATGKVLADWAAPGVVHALALADGAGLIAVGRDGFARRWDLTASPPTATWSARVPRGLRAAATFDGKRAAVTSVNRVDVFDTDAGTRLFYAERKWEDGPFQSVAFAPGGHLLAAGAQGSQGGVTVWETATGMPVRRFAGKSGSVTHVAFLDGRRLASAGVDENVLVWDVAPPRADPPSDDDLKAAWVALLRRDAAVGVSAALTLAAAGDRGLAVIRAGAADATGLDAHIKKLIADLDAPAFATRTAAAKALLDLGLRALPAVAAAADSPSAEVRQRAGDLLAAYRKAGETIPAYGLYAEPLRAHRAAWACDLIGGPGAAAAKKALGGK